MKKTVLSLIACALLAGCATDVANRYYGGTTYPPKPVEQVVVLHSRPDRNFIVLADFQSRGETPHDMQARAASIGADAVIVTTLGGQYYTGDQWASHDTMANTYSRIVGTAIKYTR